MQILGGLAHEQNRAVIIVTHDVRLQAFADRVLFMEDGRLHVTPAQAGEGYERAS